MKAAYLSFFAIAVLFVDFVFAQNFSQSQKNVGPTEQNSSSANYQLKAIVTEAGGGRSQSANYIYNHGTTWVTAAACPPPPSCLPPPSGMTACPALDGSGCIIACGTPVPQGQSCSGGGGGGAGGGGSSVGGGGGSGSGIGGGGTTTQSKEDGDVGGATSAIDTPASYEAIEEALPAREVAVPRSGVSQRVQQSLEREYLFPEIIRGVDENNIVREVAVVMMARVVPMPLWLALALLILGIIALLMVRGDDTDTRRGNLWLASGLIVAGLVVGWATKVVYQDEIHRFDETKITSSVTVMREDVGETMKEIVLRKSIGVHRIIVIDELGYEDLQITIYVKGALPI